MGLLDRVMRLFRANVNDLVSKAEDPEKVLEQSVLDMQEDLIQLRQAVASAIATQKRTQQQYIQADKEATTWQQRAQLALQKGEESLAREALVRKKAFTDTANTLKATLEQQNAQVETLKRNLIGLESKISEAKTKKDMLKARVAAAKAQEQLSSTIGSINTSGSMAAFERMEEKVLQMEAKAGAVAELSGSSLDQQFRALEGGTDIDAELAALKAGMTGGPSKTLPGASVQTNEVVDSELENLRKELNKL